MASEGIVERVRRAAAQRLLFLPHAVRQMVRPERMITSSEVRTVVEQGELIEDYPEDERGHSCLVHGRGIGRSIHVVCAPKDGYLALILRLTFLRLTSGSKTYKRGESNELCPLSRQDEALDSAFSR